MRFKTALSLVLLVLALSGCVSPGGPNPPDQNGLTDGNQSIQADQNTLSAPPKTGKLALFWRDENSEGWDAIIALQSIDLESSQGYWVRASGARYVEFSKARDRNVFLGEVALPPGKYPKLHIQLFPSQFGRNGVLNDVLVPGKRISLDSGLEVLAGQESVVQLTLDTNQSVVWRQNTAPGQWVFMPVIRVQSTRGALVKQSPESISVVGGGPLFNRQQFFDLNANNVSEAGWRTIQSIIGTPPRTASNTPVLKPNEFLVRYDGNGFDANAISVKFGTASISLSIQVPKWTVNPQGYDFRSTKNNYASGQVIPGRTVTTQFTTVRESFIIYAYVAGTDRPLHYFNINVWKDENSQ